MKPVKVKAENVVKIFGPHPQRALELLRAGKPKDVIYQETGNAVGVADVSFEVYEGEILVIMGLSGSGKSSLIRCINRLNEITSGQLLIDGTDITQLNHTELLQFRRRKFGMVFQHFALFPHRTILANTEYGLEIQGVDKASREQKAREALSLVGLAGWEEAMPKQLSGGMQQRVGLARALAIEPDILLMDEAFSALDPLIRRDMQYELVALQERMKKTIIFITHDLDEAINIGDRIILMKDGEIVQTGTAEEILTQPANEYVERFVESVDKSRVLSAQSIIARARAVGYPNDGPRTVLRKMEEEDLSSLLIVNRGYQLQGIVTAEAASNAVKRGDKTIESVIDRTLATAKPEDTMNTLISLLADQSAPVPVVDTQNKLLGVVVKGAVLSALAANQDSLLTSEAGIDTNTTPQPETKLMQEPA